jgi:hypothetical protein
VLVRIERELRRAARRGRAAPQRQDARRPQ